MTNFGSSEEFTIGVEEEFQIIDTETGELVSRIDEVLGKTEPGYEENIHSEIFQSVVETATPVCHDLDELEEEIRNLRGAIVERLEEKGYGVAAAGTHPFARWEDQDITDRERYKELVDELKWPAKRELAFGQHVHVGLQSPEQAIYVMNGLRPFLPLLLALSVNSPFWKGEPTGLMSTRLRVFDALPRTGIPRHFDDWDHFEATFQKLKAGGGVEDFTKLWWDVRPRPDLGTVEIRISDLPTRVQESVDIAAVTVAFVAGLARRHDRGEPLPFKPEPEIVDENRWRAIRHGTSAKLIRWNVENPAEDEIEEVSLEDVYHDARRLLGDVAEELGLDGALKRLELVAVQGSTGAQRQIDHYERHGDLADVVHEIRRLTRP